MGYTSINNRFIQDRVKKIREQLVLDNIKGLLIFTDEFRPSYSLYISDYRPVENLEFSPQGVYISQEKIILFLGKLNKTNAQTVSWIRDIRDIETINNFFNKMKSGETIGLCGIEKIPFFYKRIIDNISNNINFVNYDKVLDNLRLYKNVDEIKLIKMASITADNTMKYMLENIKPDISTEVGIAAKGEFFIRSKGMDLGYDTIIASGKNTMDKTWRPSSDVIRKGDILLINIVPRYKGYCSFFTISQAINNSYAQEICSISKKIIKYMIENIKQGDSSNKIYELYYEKTMEYGLLNHFLPFSSSEKSIGHSTGLEVVEYPYINNNNDIILENNMILSLKYNLYNFEFGDIRFEFNVLIDHKAILLNKYLIEK